MNPTDQPTPNRESSTDTLIKALRILARDIQSEDGVANAAIAEAADRLERYQRQLEAGTNAIEVFRTMKAEA